MEFDEKLQKLRADRGLTQEELARQLYVSRTAVSKWESGRGYPGLDSLKAIAAFFGVTVDELIGSGELVTLAQREQQRTRAGQRALVCGTLDCLLVMLLFLPVFGNGSGGSWALAALPGVSRWQRGLFAVLPALTAAVGLCTLVLAGRGKPSAACWGARLGVLLSVLCTLLFMLTRQPYAAAFAFCLLAGKLIFTLQRR